jgi:hypothetical protein
MPPKGSGGFKQDWDAIGKINNDLTDLQDAVNTSAKRYAGDSKAKPEHFGTLDPASGNAGSAATEAMKQISTAIDDASAYLAAFTKKTEAGVKTHQKNDEAAQDDYVNTQGEV